MESSCSRSSSLLISEICDICVEGRRKVLSKNEQENAANEKVERARESSVVRHTHGTTQQPLSQSSVEAKSVFACPESLISLGTKKNAFDFNVVIVGNVSIVSLEN
jgi:hypothetical protein